MMDDFSRSKLAEIHRAIESVVCGDLRGSSSRQHQIGTIKSALSGICDEATSLWLATSVSIQTKAKRKFGNGFWIGDERSLAQSTSLAVAQLKASWLPVDSVVDDWCCGIGGDLMGFASQHQVNGFDCDPRMIIAATLNLMTAGLIQGDVQNTALRQSSWDGRSTVGSEDRFLHIDPDRRVDGRRTTHAGFHNPPWSDIALECNERLGGMIKLAPTCRLQQEEQQLLSQQQHRVWISFRRSVSQQLLLFGDLVGENQFVDEGRSAWIVASDATAVSFFENPLFKAGERLVSRLPETGDFLVDPDRAIRAAGLTECFAAETKLDFVSDPSGFLVGPSIDFDPGLAVTGKVSWVGSSDDRKLRREMRAMDVFPTEIKVRGSEHDPESLRSRYDGCGSKPVTLWIGRHGKRRFAAITESVSFV